MIYWDSEDFDDGIYGFNFMVQVFGSMVVNGVWVLFGSYKIGKVDIKKLVEEFGSEWIVDMVLLICDVGDVVMCNC